MSMQSCSYVRPYGAVCPSTSDRQTAHTRNPDTAYSGVSFRGSELRREVLRGRRESLGTRLVCGTKWEASSSEVDVDSITTRLRVGSGTVRETPKSHYSRRTRRVARSVS